jgi:hypothetical protein
MHERANAEMAQNKETLSVTTEECQRFLVIAILSRAVRLPHGQLSSNAAVIATGASILLRSFILQRALDTAPE